MKRDDDFSHETIRRAIEGNKPILLTALRQEIAAALRKLSPSESLTIRLLEGQQELRRIEPAASADFAGAIVAFCRGKKHDGCELDSAVTPLVMATIEAEMTKFFSSSQVTESISSAVLAEFAKGQFASTVVQRELKDQAKWVQREFKTITHHGTAHSIAGNVIDLTATQVHDFLSTSLGKQLMLAIGKMMATTTGKVMIANILKVAVAKVIASVAFKTALISIVRKVGVGILIKTAIGKALLAMLAAVGIAHVPIVWILLPIIVGFLAYEYNTFPEKLSVKIPDAAAEIIDEKFPEIAESVSLSIVSMVFSEIAQRVTEIKFD